MYLKNSHLITIIFVNEHYQSDFFEIIDCLELVHFIKLAYA